MQLFELQELPAVDGKKPKKDIKDKLYELRTMVPIWDEKLGAYVLPFGTKGDIGKSYSKKNFILQYFQPKALEGQNSLLFGKVKKGEY